MAISIVSIVHPVDYLVVSEAAVRGRELAESRKMTRKTRILRISSVHFQWEKTK